VLEVLGLAVDREGLAGLEQLQVPQPLLVDQEDLALVVQEGLEPQQVQAPPQLEDPEDPQQARVRQRPQVDLEGLALVDQGDQLQAQVLQLLLVVQVGLEPQQAQAPPQLEDPEDPQQAQVRRRPQVDLEDQLQAQVPLLQLVDQEDLALVVQEGLEPRQVQARPLLVVPEDQQQVQVRQRPQVELEDQLQAQVPPLQLVDQEGLEPQQVQARPQLEVPEDQQQAQARQRPPVDLEDLALVGLEDQEHQRLAQVLQQQEDPEGLVLVGLEGLEGLASSDKYRKKGENTRFFNDCNTVTLIFA